MKVKYYKSVKYPTSNLYKVITGDPVKTGAWYYEFSSRDNITGWWRSCCELYEFDNPQIWRKATPEEIFLALL